MPHTKFTVEILTPDGEVFNDEVESVSTRTTIGEIGIYANHSPLLGMLEPTELRVHRSDDEVLRFAQSEGYIQVANNHVMLLLEDVTKPEDLDASEIREKLSEAERELDAADEGSERQRQAVREQKRWTAYLKVVEG